MNTTTPAKPITPDFTKITIEGGHATNCIYGFIGNCKYGQPDSKSITDCPKADCREDCPHFVLDKNTADARMKGWRRDVEEQALIAMRVSHASQYPQVPMSGFEVIHERRHILIRYKHSAVKDIVLLAGAKPAVKEAYEAKYGRKLEYNNDDIIDDSTGIVDARNRYDWNWQKELVDISDTIGDKELAGDVGLADIPKEFDPDVMDWLYLPRSTPDMSDKGIMARFHRVYNRVMRRIVNTKEWMVFDGNMWRADLDGTMLRWFLNVVSAEKDRKVAVAQNLEAKIDEIRQRAKPAEEGKKSMSSPDDAKELSQCESDLKKAKAEVDRMKGATSVKYLNGLTENGLIYFKDLNIEEEHFDLHPEYINFKNTTIDVTKLTVDKDGKLIRSSIAGAMHPHRPEDMQLNMIPHDFNPDAEKNADFDKFILEIHNNDLDLLNTMQESIGYSCTGYTDERTAWILYGEGDNGKSTLCALIRDAVGNYADTTSAELLLYSKNKSAYEASLMMNRLANVRIVFIFEPDINQQLDIAKLKQLTGGEDRVMRRVMGKGYSSFVFKGKIYIVTNHLPGVSDPSNSAWKRIFQIPYDTQFTGRIDKNLPDKLRKAIQYVLLWIVEGAARYTSKKAVHRATSAVKATDEYRVVSDDLAEFCEICFDKDAAAYVVCIEAYKIYKDYCARAGTEPMKEVMFRRRMAKRPGWKPESWEGGSVRVYKGWMQKPGWVIPTYETLETPVYAKPARQWNDVERKVIEAVKMGFNTPEDIAARIMLHADDVRVAMASLKDANEIREDHSRYYIK